MIHGLLDTYVSEGREHMEVLGSVLEVLALSGGKTGYRAMLQRYER